MVNIESTLFFLGVFVLFVSIVIAIRTKRKEGTFYEHLECHHCEEKGAHLEGTEDCGEGFLLPRKRIFVQKLCCAHCEGRFERTLKVLIETTQATESPLES